MPALPHLLPIDIPAGVKLRAALQWNQPFLQYNLGPGASVDLDLYLFDSNLKILESGEEAQFNLGRPAARLRRGGCDAQLRVVVPRRRRGCGQHGCGRSERCNRRQHRRNARGGRTHFRSPSAFIAS
jgi:hypothetical protein